MNIKKLLAVGVILLFTGTVFASGITANETTSNQTVYYDENGTLSGYVKDTSMNPIERVVIRALCGENYFENVSDSSGYYYIDNIPIVFCLWNVSASKKGYKTSWAEMSIGENTTYDFVLTTLDKIYVDDDNTAGPWDGSQEHPYNKIQDGINASENGDTVYVFNGIYYENNIFINVSITISGENRNATIINANQEINAICLYTKNININGLNIKNASMTGINFQSNNSHHVNISNNIFSNNAHAIHPYFPNEHTIVSNNIFSDNYNGFTLVGCVNASVYQNIFINNYRSIGIYGSEYCDIFKNNFQYSKSCGIFLYGFSKFNYIHHNNFIKDSNSINAYFVQFSHMNIWDENYWNEPKIMPYPIIGSLGLGIPSWINFDWHPAQEPYEIS